MKNFIITVFQILVLIASYFLILALVGVVMPQDVHAQSTDIEKPYRLWNATDGGYIVNELDLTIIFEDGGREIKFSSTVDLHDHLMGTIGRPIKGDVMPNRQTFYSDSLESYKGNYPFLNGKDTIEVYTDWDIVYFVPTGDGDYKVCSETVLRWIGIFDTSDSNTLLRWVVWTPMEEQEQKHSRLYYQSIIDNKIHE